MNINDLDSPSSEAAGPERPKYQFLIVFGFGYRPRTRAQVEADPDGKHDRGWHLTVGTKARILAAGELWRSGQIHKVILSEGTAKGAEKSGGEYMARYLKAKYPEIPDEDILREDQASNTIENFAGALNQIDNFALSSGHPVGKIALLSNRFHIVRIQKIAERFNVEADPFTAEAVLEHSFSEKEVETGRPYRKRFDLWEKRMSTPEGNRVWRDPNEVAYRLYSHFFHNVLDSLSVQVVSNLEDEEAKQAINNIESVLPLIVSPSGRDQVDQVYRNLNLGPEYPALEDLKQTITSRFEQLKLDPENPFKGSYEEYLEDENRWDAGMDKVPSYWLLQAAKVNSSRFREMLKNPKNEDAVQYIISLGFTDPNFMDDDEFKVMQEAISSDQFIKEHRELPPEEWAESPPTREGATR